MGDVQTVISLVVAGVLGGIGIWRSRLLLRKAGIGVALEEITKNLRELSATWEQKYVLEHDARMNAESALAAVKAEQFADARLASQCRRDLDDALSQIRDLERRRRPRGPRVGEGA